MLPDNARAEMVRNKQITKTTTLKTMKKFNKVGIALAGVVLMSLVANSAMAAYCEWQYRYICNYWGCYYDWFYICF